MSEATGLKLGLAEQSATPPLVDESLVRQETVWVEMRDGARLATDVYLPPDLPAPAVALRTPYGRADTARRTACRWLARRGFAAISQDCRGTGDSEPDAWDYYVFESEDSLDFVQWVSEQPWFDGFLGSFGSSYSGAVQWCMAMHPAMSAIAPQVAGLGLAPNTRPHFYMYLNAYSLSVGKGPNKTTTSNADLEREMLDETLAGGYFNELLQTALPEAVLELFPELLLESDNGRHRVLYERYSELPSRERANLIKLALGTDHVTSADIERLPAIFGHQVTHDAHMLPRARESELIGALNAPALVITGWYDWCLDDALATWQALVEDSRASVSSRSRLLITPAAHNTPGYHEGAEQRPELDRSYLSYELLDVLVDWYRAVREDDLDEWPRVTYYLMGANEWRTAPAWPPPDAVAHELYLTSGGELSSRAPDAQSEPDRYTYDPENPTPTMGGSIVSRVYTPGSVDVSDAQRRADVLTYTSPVLDSDLDVVGPLRLFLHASSSAVDTDFCARLTDVFPDGRAIQLQAVTLRARYRNPTGDPELLEAERIYLFEIDMWATANRFRAGHRIRLDLSSADFPKYDRNTNRGGEPGPPLPALQTIYHDVNHPSHLLVQVIGPQRSFE